MQTLAVTALVVAGLLAVGEGPALYEPPAPGTYELPPIGTVTEHVLLDESGRPAKLLGLATGQVAVVSFIYKGCAEADGCPLALAVLRQVDRALAKDAALAKRTRLVSASFDPGRDRPEDMKALRALMEPKTGWRFLTPGDHDTLDELLAAFGQHVVRLVDEKGDETGVFRHVMKVFLVDAQGRIRNIYSTGTLDPRLVLNDVRTVLVETD